MKKLLTCLAAIIVAVSFLTGCVSTDAIRALEREMKEYGFSGYRPPRANHGPGWVFRFAKTYDNNTVMVTVCDFLYPKNLVVPVKGSVSLLNRESTETLDLSLGLKVIGDLVQEISKAEASLKSKSVTTLRVTWSKVEAEEIPDQYKFNAEGKLQPLDPACSAAIRQIRDRGNLDTVFVVQEALRAESIDISVDANVDRGAQLDVELSKLLQLKPNVSWKDVSKSSVKVIEPRYVGFKAVAMIDFRPTDQLGPETVRVSGRVLTFEQAQKLAR